MKISIRSQFVAEKGQVLIACDLSQAESWVVSHLAEETKMIDALKFGDVHILTATSIYGVAAELIQKNQRYIGKRGNHMLGYDATYLRFAQAINQDSDKPPFVTISNSESKKIVDGWHLTYPGVRNKFHRNLRDQLWKNRIVKTAYGRTRTFYGALNDENYKMVYAHVPQSSIADHTNGIIHPLLGVEGGIKAIRKYITKPSNGEIQLLNQSHDSALLMCPKEIGKEILEKVHGYMQRPLIVNGEEFIIPADGEMGDRYGELEKVDFLPHPYRKVA